MKPFDGTFEEYARLDLERRAAQERIASLEAVNATLLGALQAAAAGLAVAANHAEDSGTKDAFLAFFSDAKRAIAAATGDHTPGSTDHTTPGGGES